MQEQPCDGESNDEVRPGTAEPGDQSGSDHHGEVADGVVPGEQPYGPHVGVALAVF